MTNKYYEESSLIGKYKKACEQAECSLNENQISLLEKTLNEAFMFKKNKSPPADVFRKIDRDVLNYVARNRGSDPGRLINVLKKYREINLGITDDLLPNEADAWSLCCLTSKEIRKTTYSALKKKHGLPKTYGIQSFGMLFGYFRERGIIDKDTPFPMPIDEQY